MPQSADRAFWSWLGFWLQLLVLAALALTGAGFAGLGQRPGDYASGMVLLLASLAVAFLRLKHYFDGGGPGLTGFLFVSATRSLLAAIPVLLVLGLGGLVVARTSRAGTLHAAGIAFAVVCALVIFLDIKHVFDRIDADGK